MKEFRNLTADEIDVRIAQMTAKGAMLLLYKDARVDQNILDEKFGIFGWERTHQLIGDRLYCTVRVKNPDTGEWISKQDVGTESNTEKEKGQASDAFKRACFNLGIGRELYSSPRIFVANEKMNITNGKTYDRFRVKKIGYTKAGDICQLTIVNDSKKGMVVFDMGKTEEPEEETPEIKAPYPPRDEMLELVKKKYPEGTTNHEALLASFGVKSLDKASDAQLMVIWNKYAEK